MPYSLRSRTKDFFLAAGFRWRRMILVLAAIMCAFPGCGKRQDSSSNPKAPPALPEIAAGDLRARFGMYGVVFYYTPDPLTPPEETARTLAAEHLPEFTFTTNARVEGEGSLLAFREEVAPLKEFPVPESSYFQHAGRGLSPKDIEAIQATSRATVLTLIIPRERIWPAARSFTEFVHAFAVKTGAFIWDSATRECFSVAEWRERRLDTWPAEDLVPNLSAHFTIHLYRAEDDSPRNRAITLGMEKFALPDIVIERLIRSNGRNAGNLINLVSQSLAENPTILDGSRHIVRIDDLKHKGARDSQKESLFDGATEQITLGLVEATPREGDPDNRLIELRFHHASGRDEDEQQEAAFSGIWGSRDSIQYVEHTDDVLAASKRARSRIPELRQLFEKGLPPGSRLMLKSPFKHDKGNEWMWAEVIRWPAEGKVEAILQNTPFHVNELTAGSRVKFDQDLIFDYILYQPDGTMEGNETSKAFEAQEK